MAFTSAFTGAEIDAALGFANDGAAKTRVNFNDTGVVAILEAVNGASITDNGTGNYTVTATNAMASAGYAVALSASLNDVTVDTTAISAQVNRATAPTASAINVLSTIAPTGSPVDTGWFTVGLTGELA